MALTSVGGASLTRNSIAFTIQQTYGAWIKIPSHADRLLFDHGGVKIRTNVLGNIVLDLGGSLFTGITVLPLNTWIYWAYKNTAANGNQVSIRYIECINNIPTLTSTFIEISVTEVISGVGPAFTVHIPAGCSICGFKYGGPNINLVGAFPTWGNSGPASYYGWMTPLRFPNDLYDHREIGGGGFLALHAWDAISGSILLDPNDPEIMLDKICSAVVAISFYDPPIEISHPPAPCCFLNQSFFSSMLFPATILTDVLPVTAVLNRITFGSFAIFYYPVNLPGPDITPIGDNSYVQYGANPTQFHYEAAIGTVGHYDWSYWAAPNPQTNNPSTGLPWTLADFYGMVVKGESRWGPFSYQNPPFGPPRTDPANLIPVRVSEFGIACLYFGQTTAPTCGSGPPPTNPVGTIIINKIVVQ